MKIFWTYFYFEWKKSIAILGKSLLGLVLSIFLLFTGVTAVSVFLLQSQAFKKVQVAVIIPEKETLVRQAADFAAAMESVESVCQLHYLSKGEAWQKLETGEIEAIIQIPENFYEDVYSGVNTPATLYIPVDSALNTKVFCELLSQAVSMLQNSQAGVYAVLSMARDQETRMDRSAMGDFLAREYALEILKRDKAFEETVLSATGELETKEYYFLTALLLVLLFTGLLFGFLYKERNRAVEEKLAMYGLNKKRISLAKILTMASVLWMLALVIYLLSWSIFFVMDWKWLPLRWQVFPGLGLLSLALGAWFHLLFSLGGRTMQSVVNILGVNLLMVLCCGLILPAAYFPETIQRLGRVLPLYEWSQYMQKLIFINGAMESGLWILAGTVITTGLGAYVYEKIH